MTRKIIFKHGRALGDALMFTCGIRDFKLLFPDIEINVDSNFPALWENNPHLTRTLQQSQEGVEFYKVGYPIINNSNNSSMHFTQGFLLDMIAVADGTKSLGMSIGEFSRTFSKGSVGDYDLGVGNIDKEPFATWKEKYDKITKQGFGRQYADIFLTEQEKSYDMIKDVYGVEKYWLIAPGGKTDCTCKIWDWRRFQKVVDHFDGLIKFVTIGKSEHVLERLDNVIDLTDKFNKDIRSLLPLTYHAEGCVSGVTFLMHLAAAMPPKRKNERKPCVSIYGGREPTSFTAYCNHQILHTNGAFDCCDNGGCWHSRVVPLGTSPSRNTRICRNPLLDNGRTIPACMNAITSDDVIRSLEKYYDGNIYSYMKPQKKKIEKKIEIVEKVNEKELNLLASLSSKGGGEQSALKVAEVLRESGWKINFHPWDSVHKNYIDKEICKGSFKDGMLENMKSGLPLLFYANDQIGPFLESAQDIVNKSSDVIIGINYINSSLPKNRWLDTTNKLRAVIFQNQEKKNEFERDRIGFEHTKQIVLFGAIDLNQFLEILPKEKKDDLVILKHCTSDWRKYITTESAKAGEKIHLWQKNIIKEDDMKFYSRLLKDTKNTRFEFMEAHKEIADFFKNEPRMIFHKWDSIPVTEFLARGHIYLYRTSNAWRDQYPRVVAEALAAGLPVLSEPRDGTKDRMDYGNIGFHCVDYDGFLYAIKLLQRKEKYRQRMAMEAKSWAKNNLDPKKWVEVINGIIV